MLPQSPHPSQTPRSWPDDFVAVDGTVREAASRGSVTALVDTGRKGRYMVTMHVRHGEVITLGCDKLTAPQARAVYERLPIKTRPWS
jgi:hypothetical protein